MLNLDAVVSTADIAGFTAWPITDPPAAELLPLSGRLSPVQVGTALAVIARYNAGSADHDIDPQDGPGLLRHLTQAEALIAPGGLRVRDTTTSVEVVPGCCCGLEDWREWHSMLHGETPWLGHDPTPHLEHAGGLIRLWPQGGDEPTPPRGALIEIRTAELPDLLATAQRQLSGFLDLVTAWADHHAPELTARLVAAIDTHMRISQDPSASV